MLRKFIYHRPGSIDEAVKMLGQPNARVLAGGTDIIVSIRNGSMSPSHLVDIKGIKELKNLQISDRELFIGAAVTINELIESREVREKMPLLAEAGATLASHQVRNRATVVGNLCNASPAADMAPALLVLNAAVDARGKNGSREIALKDFFTSVKRNCLLPDEIVTRIRLPLAKGRGRYLKKSRSRGHDLSAVGVAGFYDGTTVRLAVGACAPTPVCCEFDAAGMKYDEILETAREQVKAIINPIDDIRAGKEYRAAIVDIYLERILGDILQQEGDIT